jgi:hypothetical protein
MIAEPLSYKISEKDYNKKIYPFLRKWAEVMRAKTNEFYDFDAKVQTKERNITHYLYDGTKVIANLDKDNNMTILLQLCQNKNLINKLEKLSIKK